ncbi:MAG: hypothetical protein GXP55_10230 [Deltaproteobacteria bacterium]|nr:hypothetical protein [Deltaproteobacteria bacterium]
MVTTNPTSLRIISIALLFASACAASSGGDFITTRSGPGDPPPDATECVGDADCPGDFVCRVFSVGPRCVLPEDLTPRVPGDGTTCGDCPAPGECRDSVCVQPDAGGAFCEFDPECGDGMLCIAGRCTPDPRIPTSCADSTSCGGGLVCSMDGRCVCETTSDCPVGLICAPDGSCVPDDPGGCVADDECPAGGLCDGGRCIPGDACFVVDPPLDGTWDLNTVLRLREALPGWLGGFLDAVAGPFHLIAGHTSRLDLGLPGWVEDLAATALTAWADANLAPWQRQLLGAIADMNDILSTWDITEFMTLRGSGIPDAYTGTHEWTEVAFTYRGMPVRGRPEDILDWRFAPSPFEANATCGTLNIERHDVNVSIGAIIAWAVNAVIFEATDGRYATLDDALTATTAGFCDSAAREAAAAVDFPGVEAATYSWCSRTLGGLVVTAVDALNNARLGLDLMTLKGHAPIVTDRLLTPGVWEGTLPGGDFTGDFTANKR